MSKKNVIVLFYPKTWKEVNNISIPFALLFLERMIRDLDIDVILIDERITEDYIPVLIKYKDRILLAGVSSMTGYQIKGGIEFSKRVKYHIGCRVIWGGWHPTLLSEQTLREDFIDFIITGQGELPFRNFVKTLLADGDYTDIKGLGYKVDGKLIINPMEEVRDPGSFPDINFDLVNINDYVIKSGFPNNSLWTFASYGCPFNCAFCSMAVVYKKHWYHRKVDEIISEIIYFKSKAVFEIIRFEDANFFVNRNFTVALCTKIIENNLNIKWYTNGHAAQLLKDYSDVDLDLIKKAGCDRIFIGAESGDQDILNIIQKRSKVDYNIEVVKKLKKHNIKCVLSLMICFPIDPEKDFMATLEMLKKIKLLDRDSIFSIKYFFPMPGTELYQVAVDKGFSPPSNLIEWYQIAYKRFDYQWGTKKINNILKLFEEFYFLIINPGYYKFAPRRTRLFVYLVNKFLYPFVLIRFKINFFRFPLEAILFLKIIYITNRLFGTTFSLKPKPYKYVE